jgi:hypothetical protein
VSRLTAQAGQENRESGEEKNELGPLHHFPITLKRRNAGTAGMRKPAKINAIWFGRAAGCS